MSDQHVLAAVADLFFRVKIESAASRASLPIVFAQNAANLMEAAVAKPIAIVLDLSWGAVEPIETIRALKSDPSTATVPIVAFYPHVQTELKAKAEQAGCDFLIARSKFEQSLPNILSGIAGS